MKRFLMLALFVMLAVCVVISVASCSGECKHNITHTDYIQDPAPTCIAPGKTVGITYCDDCGNEIDRFVSSEHSKLSHSEQTYIENEITVSCTTNASYELVTYCTVCETELSRETVITEYAYGHDSITDVWEESPTCTTAGSITYAEYCRRCQKYVSEDTEVLDPLGHAPGEAVIENNIDPTCTVGGSYDLVTCCSRCDEELESEHKTVGALGHYPAEPVVENVSNAVCTSPGFYDEVVYCSTCDEELSREQKYAEAALGHKSSDPIIENETKPTCTEGGYHEEVIICYICKEELSRNPVNVDPLGHTESDVIVENNIDPTCTEYGSYEEVIICYICKEELSRTPVNVDPLGHTESDVIIENNIDPTCTEYGSYEEVINCLVCKEELSREIAFLDPLGHDEVVHDSKAPTCLELGWDTYITCDRCGHTTYNELPALGHDEVYHDAQEPTCEAIGWDAYVNCKRCDYTTYNELSALGHSYVDETCVNCGLVRASNGLYYELVNNDYYKVIGFDPISKSVVIPSTYKGLPVTTIGRNVFENCKTLEAITIPASIEVIGQDAFYGCINLREVHIEDLAKWCNVNLEVFGNPLEYTQDLYVDGNLVTNLVIPEGVTSISQDAFYGCKSIVSVTLPSTLTSIGNYAFWGCDKIVEVVNKSSLNITSSLDTNGGIGRYAMYIHSGVSKIYNVNGYLFFTYNFTNYLLGYSGTTADLVLPDNYNGNAYEIYKYAFYNSTNLTNLVIPDSITSIGENAFAGCPVKSATIPTSAISHIPMSNLETLVITSGVSIPASAFENSEKLMDITIPSSITSIGSNAFYNCTSLTNIYISDIYAWCSITFEGKSPEHTNPLSGAKNLYINNRLVINLEIPEGMESIGTYSFYNCTSIVSVSLPTTLKTIGSYAFYGCTQISEVENYSSLNIIAGSENNGYVAYYAANVDKVESKLIAVGDFVFQISSQGIYLVKYTGRDTYVTLPNAYNGKNYEIGKNMNWGSAKITDVVISNGVTAIGNSAFSGLTSLVEVTIPDSVTSIGPSAFASCSSLKSVVIPDSVKTIEASTFLKCTSLESVSIGSSVTHIGYSAFSQCTSLRTVVIPDNVLSIGDYAFSMSHSITSVTIGRGLKTLGKNSFGTSVRKITILADLDNYAYAFGSSPIEIAKVPLEALQALPKDNLRILELFGDGVIPKDSFVDCMELLSITIGEGITDIESGAFLHCRKLVEIINYSSLDIVAGSNTFGSIAIYAKDVLNLVPGIDVGYYTTCVDYYEECYFYSVDGVAYLMSYAGSDEEVILPSDYRGNKYELYGYAFFKRTDITCVEFSMGVTAIGPSVFFGCTNLTNVSLSNSITRIDDDAFMSCASLTKIVIPSSVVYIPYGIFDYCDNLVIYCRASSKPSGWNQYWSSFRPVVWGYTGE